MAHRITALCPWLQGPEELVYLGLKVLESWVESVNPEFMEQVGSV